MFKITQYYNPGCTIVSTASTITSLSDGVLKFMEIDKKTNDGEVIPNKPAIPVTLINVPTRIDELPTDTTRKKTDKS